MIYRSKDTVPMTVTLGILALLKARPGKGEHLAAFRTPGRDLAAAGQGTATWNAFKISDTSYGTFAHLRHRPRPHRAHQRPDTGRARPGTGRPAGPRTGHPARQPPSRQVRDQLER